MRAQSPVDFFGGKVAAKLPTPKFNVGDDVSDFRCKGYYRKCTLVHFIDYFRFPYWQKRTRVAGKLPEHQKELIRKFMKIIDSAHRVTVAGVIPTYGHVINYVANQCYIEGVPGAASGVGYTYHLLYQANIDGKELAIIPTVGVTP